MRVLSSEYLTTAQAAVRLNTSRARVTKVVRQNRALFPKSVKEKSGLVCTYLIHTEEMSKLEFLRGKGKTMLMSNVMEAEGEKKTVGEWLEDTRVTVRISTLRARIKAEWTEEDALLIPAYGTIGPDKATRTKTDLSQFRESKRRKIESGREFLRDVDTAHYSLEAWDEEVKKKYIATENARQLV